MKDIVDLYKTDPKLMELFKSLYEDKELKDSGLDKKTEALAALAVNIGLDSTTNFYSAVYQALKAGVSPLEIKETVYLTAPLIGFAKTYSFIEIMNTVFEEEGIGLPIENETTVNQSDKGEKELVLMEELFKQYQSLQSAVEEFQSFDQWLVETGFDGMLNYGDFDLKTREMILFCVLYTMRGMEKEMEMHINVNMNVGNDKEFLVHLLEACIPHVGVLKTYNALSAIKKIA